MLICPEAQDFPVEIAFTDYIGTPVTPISYEIVLLDDLDRTVFTWSGVPTAAQITAQMLVHTIPATHHMLTDTAVRMARTLRVTFQTTTGSARKALGYIVEAVQMLQVLKNTFQSYHAADALSLSLTNVLGWVGADETRRKAALAEAYSRIIAIPLSYATDPDLNTLNAFNTDTAAISDLAGTISREMWGEITVENFVTFPSRFRRALALAQVLEANELLQGDTVLDRFRAGIISETIGESSVRLSSGRLDYGISVPALKALTGYIRFDMRIARA